MESPRNMPQQLTRIFALVLIILAGVLTLQCNTSLLHAQSTEICDNGIDDDGDSLIDCFDPDCNFPLFSDSSYGNSESQDVALGDLDGDGVNLLAYLFNNGPNPQNPFPACGIDPTADSLECETFGGCP